MPCNTLVNEPTLDVGEIVFDYADVAGPEIRNHSVLKVEKPLLELDLCSDASGLNSARHESLRTFVVLRKTGESIKVRGHEIRVDAAGFIAVVSHEARNNEIIALFRADLVEGIHEVEVTAASQPNHPATPVRQSA